MAFTASSSSFWRRPVMKMYAPSLTKSLAEAKPIPVVPPVTTATLPRNLPMILTPAHDRDGRNLVVVALQAENPPPAHCQRPPSAPTVIENRSVQNGRSGYG